MSPSVLRSQTAVVLHGARDLRVEQRTLWPPQQGHVQIDVRATGLCGSDLHYYLHGRNGDFALQAPLVLGHEAAGVITALGPSSSSSSTHGFYVGQRVAIEAGIKCGQCSYCAKGRYNLCKNMRFASSAKTFPHLDGTLQERMNHPASCIHPLPDNVSFEQAALAEPLSVLIHASRRAGLSSSTPPSQLPTSMIVLGVGAIGLLACAVARTYGIQRVCAIDINRARLDFALAHGFADAVFCLPPPTGEKPKNADEQLKRAKDAADAALREFGLTEDGGADVVYECTGAEPCIQQSIFLAAAGAKVLLIGMGTRQTVLPLSAAATREVDVLGSFRYADTYPEALALLALEGSFVRKHAAALVSHRFALPESKRAFELLAKGRDEHGAMVLKVVISPDGAQAQ
ncbi:uncharacterized protein PHACADRAFT_251356 [Phanerochaete carnosa HHB-10118-sp]|uniref:Enoyl reductase (ER) domain-containing protein n=1 Tax=Phanerochaete carnosa (strain HHB-10118-sp) TaxID=650164 RepID=K5V4S1_PHACS|nr:uncharacterized protein PHACADRAFT_251356 [Phanerochaete carnosa HHB-10118-sp]EKM57626.1 hypothetical protein PHACADRAFT_251356 [Phanerochaete carnosa HHB-10118-sp]